MPSTSGDESYSQLAASPATRTAKVCPVSESMQSMPYMLAFCQEDPGSTLIFRGSASRKVVDTQAGVRQRLELDHPRCDTILAHTLADRDNDSSPRSPGPKRQLEVGPWVNDWPGEATRVIVDVDVDRQASCFEFAGRTPLRL